ncbi:unnamed protein product [Arabidopsis thaliana]|uniref:Uncharacterized protein n=1 Tax=Arabidopsis thaliana TaxID=3702 RepID=A0A5S9WX19_ARATH|nr:unnamed protein product [Arabidopsis thaliana]
MACPIYSQKNISEDIDIAPTSVEGADLPTTEYEIELAHRLHEDYILACPKNRVPNVMMRFSIT